MKLALIIGLTQITIFFVIIIPTLKPLAQVISSTLYTVLTLITLSSAISTAYIDPSDKKLYYEPLKYCTICKKNVEKSSKHCGNCNRCVAKFDHHCIWVNNCIGELNYKHFAVTISFLELFMLYQLCSSVLVVVWTIENKDYLNDLFKREIVFTFMAVSIAISGFCVVSNGMLIVFHVYLGLRKLSTYEFIIGRRKKGSRVRPGEDIKRFYEPYLDRSQEESFELVRAPNLLQSVTGKEFGNNEVG